MCADIRGGDGDGEGDIEAGGGGDGDEVESSGSRLGTAESLKCGVWGFAGAVGFGPEERSDGGDLCQEVPLSGCWGPGEFGLTSLAAQGSPPG